MSKVLLNKQLWLIAGLLALDGAFFCLTDPHKVTSVTLIIGFLLFVATVYLCLRETLALVKLYGLPFGRHGPRIALFGTGVVAILIGLQSMGELSTHDLFVALPLAIVLYVYLSYGRSRVRS